MSGFLATRLALDSFAACTDARAAEELLARLQDDREGSALSAAYGLVVDRINSQPANRKALAQKAMAWIVRARRPLCVAELLHALAFNEDGTAWCEGEVPPIDDVIASCAGLVSVEPETDEIRLLHKTVLDYFREEADEWMQPTEKIMAMCCMTYLQLEEPEDAFCQYIWDDWKEEE
ncbi:hypothetical protein SLS55_009186 [Diplodia seriata]|uniref:GPI inositol-deacylase winged helix domain-containing protein n=1 Tax=Diplodia seriata TaxID=420778 RepID=A0ABR3C8F8_9PEZI